MKNKLILLILAVIVIAGSVYAYQTLRDQGEDVSPEVPLTEKQEVENFVASYLTAYSSVHESQNFDEVEKFIADEVLVQMAREGTPFETNASDFNSFEILEAVKANHESYAPDVLGWEIKVKLMKGDKILRGEPITISVIKENGGWKSTSWYFGE